MEDIKEIEALAVENSWPVFKPTEEQLWELFIEEKGLALKENRTTLKNEALLGLLGKSGTYPEIEKYIITEFSPKYKKVLELRKKIDELSPSFVHDKIFSLCERTLEKGAETVVPTEEERLAVLYLLRHPEDVYKKRGAFYYSAIDEKLFLRTIIETKKNLLDVWGIEAGISPVMFWANSIAYSKTNLTMLILTNTKWFNNKKVVDFIVPPLVGDRFSPIKDSFSSSFDRMENHIPEEIIKLAAQRIAQNPLLVKTLKKYYKASYFIEYKLLPYLVNDFPSRKRRKRL